MLAGRWVYLFFVHVAISFPIEPQIFSLTNWAKIGLPDKSNGDTEAFCSSDDIKVQIRLSVSIKSTHSLHMRNTERKQ